MPNRNIYLNQETDDLLVNLSKKLNKPFSKVIEIALNKYLDDVENRSMTEFRLCYAQLTKSIEYLQACRDYGTEAENAEPWSDKDDEILELLNKAHDPLMYYNNNLVFKENPELLGEFFPEIYDKEGNKKK